jgi:hypothetical protein
MPITTTKLLSETATIKTNNAAIPSFLELEITGFCQLKCIHLGGGRLPPWLTVPARLPQAPVNRLDRRQRQPQQRPAARRCLGHDGPAVGMRDLADDGQAQPGAENGRSAVAR